MNVTVRGNAVRNNRQTGIEILAGSHANRVELNLATGNKAGGVVGYELEDQHSNCDSNLWRRNRRGAAGINPNLCWQSGSPVTAASVAATTSAGSGVDATARSAPLRRLARR